MSAISAAYEVLQQEGGPLHVSDITERAIDRGLWSSRGKTPEATIGSKLSTDISNNAGRSRFVRVGPQIFALKEWAGKPQDEGVTADGSEAAAEDDSFKFVECARKVLEERDGHPMHYRDITERALEKGWLISEGRTPAGTMTTLLNAEIRRQQEREELPLFIKYAVGYFGLLSWGDEHLAQWVLFYQAIADRLLDLRDRRAALVAAIHSLRAPKVSKLQDQFEDGSSGPLQDICPFTVMGLFNRGITDRHRQDIARELAKLLGVPDIAIPPFFTGIPVVNNQSSWFFAFAKRRQPDDIDALWEVFAQALAFGEGRATAQAFVDAYDNAAKRAQVGWNLTMGLHWIRPLEFPTLDRHSRRYIAQRFDIELGTSGPKGHCSGREYLEVRDALKGHFESADKPPRSFPNLSLLAQISGSTAPTEDEDTAGHGTPSPEPAYGVDHILNEGCFIPREELDNILQRLRDKKNLILQGPPGVGKTWLAKRLAFALIGRRDQDRIRAVQFHPNLSYEDFIRGWRPVGEGHLELVDGPFMETIATASEDPESDYVVVIEEINRGNPAQIFGEMLTLLEVDKRSADEALELSYMNPEEGRVHIPENLHVIGTMNLADRSLALVDLALRRRFAFIDLKPTFGEAWREWVKGQCEESPDTVEIIARRIEELNRTISEDTSLGPHFQVGHSYVTPPADVSIGDPKQWFRQVVETEIGPLLDEYWIDDPGRAQKAREQLLNGLDS